MILLISVESPYQWVTVSSRGVTMDSGVIESLELYRVPKSVVKVIGIAPGEKIACHSVTIPGNKKRYAEAALGFSLEERLTDDIDDLQFKLLDWQSDGNTKAVVTSKQQLSDWVSQFKEYNILLDGIVAEYFLLPLHPKVDVTISNSDSGRVSVRTAPFSGLTTDFDGFEFWWSTQQGSAKTYSVTDIELAKKLREQQSENDIQPDARSQESTPNINHWKIGSGFQDWIKLNSTDNPAQQLDQFNLLEGDFTPSHGSKSEGILKVAAFVAGIGLVLHLGLLIYEKQKLQVERDRLHNETKSLFAQHFPDEPYLDRPVSQVESLISNLKQGNSANPEFSILLNAFSEVAAANQVQLDEISYRDNGMTAVCQVRDLSSLDIIIQSFNARSDVRAELLSSGARDNVVTGRIRIIQNK